MVGAQPERLGGVREVPASQPVGVADEGGVAGLGDGLGQGDVTERGRRVVVVVLERPAVDDGRRRACHPVAHPEAAAHQRQRADHLEGRAGGVLAGRGQVRARRARAVGRRQHRPVRGPDRHQRGGRGVVAEARQRVLGVLLHGRVERREQVGAVGGADLDERPQLVAVVAGHHGGAGTAPELVVVAGLEPRQADLVAGDDPAVGLLDQLGGRGTDPTQQRGGELPGRRERQRVPHGQCSRDLPERRQHVEGVVLAQHERLHEGLGSHRLRALDVRRRVHVEDARDAACAAGHLRSLDLGLVEPVAQDGALGHQHRTALAGDVPAARGEGPQAQRVAVGQVGDEGGGGPVDPPPGLARHQRDRGVVLPRLEVGELPAPGQRRGRGGLGLLDREHLHRDRDVAQRLHQVGEAGPVCLVGEGHLAERVPRQGGREGVGDVGGWIFLVAAERGAGGADPHDQDGDPETE